MYQWKNRYHFRLYPQSNAPARGSELDLDPRPEALYRTGRRPGGRGALVVPQVVEVLELEFHVRVPVPVCTEFVSAEPRAQGEWV